MTHEEKRAWTRLIAAVGAYAVYVVIVAGRAHGQALATVPYARTLLLSIVASIVVTIVAEIVWSIGSPRASRVRDVRDKEIGRLGDHIGQSFVIIGATAAMLMAMAEWSGFWIANAIYLGFVLSALVGGVAKVVLYRRALPQW